ncbi:MAG: tRNA (N(6)-L-threonylcarbamoyladenosine(37)-C(2))-methylthiotransferase MtaB [Hyphomicrobiales bacterium]
MNKTIAFQTFGCKLNFSETSAISRELKSHGFLLVEWNEPADVYVINSCSVTGNAEKKCKTVIRQAKKRNPLAKIAVVGCFSQLKPVELSNMDEVDIVLGSSEKFNLYHHLQQIFQTSDKEVSAGSILKDKRFFPSYSLGDRTRSFLKIQDGCDYFCSYCTIPMARGRSRSGSVSQTIELAKEIGQTDIQEVVLTGVNIGDFGKGTEENFFSLLKELDKVEGIERIRISSCEPDLLTDEIIEFVAASKKFMPHFHIPLQSGSDNVLKLMKRRYPRQRFADRVKKIKELMPNACIAADVIVGFSGESPEDFQDSFNFIDSLDISYVHVFTFSERPGTVAVNMDGKVDGAEKKRRSQELHSLSERKKIEFYNSFIGQEVTVLFEADVHDGHIQGFSDNYLRVKVEFQAGLRNKIKRVNLLNIDEDGVFLAKVI